jgi:hypothetical protein
MKPSGLKLGLMVEPQVLVAWNLCCRSLVMTRTNGSELPLVSIAATLRALITCQDRAGERERHSGRRRRMELCQFAPVAGEMPPQWHFELAVYSPRPATTPRAGGGCVGTPT